MVQQTYSSTVLLVTSDPELLFELREVCKDGGHRVLQAGGVETALHVAHTEALSFVIVDMQLSEQGGLEVCRSIRWTGNLVPIIAVSSSPTESDVIVALEVGADEFLARPIRPLELLARARARMRPWKKQELAVPGELRNDVINALDFGDLTIDYRRQSAVRQGVRVELSSIQFEILRLLVNHRGNTVTRGTIRQEVWPHSDRQTNRTVDNYIVKLRQKLELAPSEPKLIVTVYGKGYKFVG